MYSELFKAVEQGASVLTGSKRLARALLEAFSAYQRDKGRSVWNTPRILPWGAYLQHCWRESLVQAPEGCPVLLNAAQEAALWENVIWESPEGRTLLRVPETAQRAMEAWQLIHAYRLPFKAGAFSASDDCEAFFKWASEFERRRDANGWIEAARLSDFVAKLLRDGRIERPFPLLLAGLDDLTPEQQDLLDALCGATEWKRREFDSAPVVAALRDTQDEIRQAAAWARHKLAANPEAKIGIVVPNLEALRSKIDRLLREVLHPGDGSGRAGSAVHISLGAPLFQHPAVHAALLILEQALGSLSPERMGMLLRSPFLKSAGAEQSSRALLDATIRNKKQPTEDSCPALHKTLTAIEREAKKVPPEQYPSDWSRTFSRLLKTAGWPGDRSPDSEEYQAMQAWKTLLSTFASLDTVSGRMTAATALTRFHKLAQDTPFQPENEGAPVEVMGLLEASGLNFDHLWVMGLHDDVMPPPARPNPFLPISLQREFDLPHSSAQRELDFSSKLLGRLTASAPDVVLSYPEWEGDQQLGRSPLIAGAAAELPQRTPSWVDAIRASAALESLDDSVAPELAAGEISRGGTSLLKDMAACPFKAYAVARLGARPLEDAAFGIDYRERGTGVHRALELIWSELKSHAALCAISEGPLQELIARSIQAALLEHPELGRSLEQRRLEKLLREWLEMEKARPPFTVLEKEQETPITVGGLLLKIRIDRVDQLTDGRRVIVDYKTGMLKSKAWLGERLDEPQVPLYCTLSGAPVAAAAFGHIRTGELHFRGLCDNGEIGPMKDMQAEKGVRLSESIERWERALHKLAADFRSGVASVDPKHKSSCAYCDLSALCRVHDSQDIPDDVDE